MSNIEYKPAEKVQIRLSRPDANTPWGFRLQGGIDFSTPLSIQSVNPGSVSERCGLKPGDAILSINKMTSDAMGHDDAKSVIIHSGNLIEMLVERGAVKIWKPQVTPLNELRPSELKTITTATGEELTPVQKTSLVANRPNDEPCRIGSSHNRSARPFGGAGSDSTPKAAVPNVVHAQFNSPIGLYSAGNLADSYSQQTAGIQNLMGGLEISEGKKTETEEKDQEFNDPENTISISKPESPESPNTLNTGSASHISNQSTPKESARYQEQHGDTPEYRGYTNPNLQSRTFRMLQAQLDDEAEMNNNNTTNSDNRPQGFSSVSAPIAKPPSEKPKQQSMTCGDCGMLATGVIVKANGVPFHVACFKCASCAVNLKQRGYFVVDEKLYCEIHAKRKAQPPGPNMVAVASYR